MAEARRLAGAGALVGLSTHSPDQVDAACVAEGDARPDQISVGPVWETPTKEGRPATGLGLIEHAAAQATSPGSRSGASIRRTSARWSPRAPSAIVVVRAIRDADDPEGAARRARVRASSAGGPDG